MKSIIKVFFTVSNVRAVDQEPEKEFNPEEVVKNGIYIVFLLYPILLNLSNLYCL